MTKIVTGNFSRLAFSPARTPAFLGSPSYSVRQGGCCLAQPSVSLSGLRVLALAQGCHVLQGCPRVPWALQRWGSSSLVCKGLTSWHFCCSTWNPSHCQRGAVEAGAVVGSGEREPVEVERVEALAWAVEDAGEASGG